MLCRDCKWMYTNETMRGLHICVNFDSDMFGEYTGEPNEDDCKYGVPFWEEDEKYDCNRTLDCVHEMDRLCSNVSVCKDECPLAPFDSCYIMDMTQEQIDVLQKWSNEHPE